MLIKTDKTAKYTKKRLLFVYCDKNIRIRDTCFKVKQKTVLKPCEKVRMAENKTQKAGDT